MAIELNTSVVRTEGMMTTPIDNEIVILNMAKNNYASLDAIGRRIWDLLETPTCVDDLCQQLSLEFEGTEEQIATDVLQFLNQLEKDELVRVAQE